MSQDKTVFVNKKTFDLVVKELGYVPENLGVSSFVADDEAVVLSEKTREVVAKIAHKVQGFS